ncbi:MAG: hypothetical protein KF684_01640 [Phycisphaeraceae bacterium]|nr:hypothetical protein [Phycisphaeraceae bacterium]
MKPGTIRWLTTLVLASLWRMSSLVLAQGAGAVGSPPGQTAEVGIAVEAFGVGEVVRAGEWAGVRLALTDFGDRPRAVAVRLHLPDPDGDTAFLQRIVTLNPGLRQGVWLYGLFPWRTDRTLAFTVTVHEFDTNATGDSEQTGVGRQLAADRVAPQNVLPPTRPVIGVLGRSPAGGLVAYELPSPSDATLAATAHELVRVALDLAPAAMPDRWMGLAPFESLAWFSGDPGALSEPQADAIREWVMRGGHLIVSLPAAGQTWTNPRTNPLHAMLPSVDAVRREGVNLDLHAPLLQPRGGAPLPDNATVHVLRPVEDAQPGEATVLLATPQGDPVVVRRIHGAGMVTLIGYDLSDPRLGARVDPQYFWHRITGKRFEPLSRDEMRALDQAGRADFRFFDATRMDIDIGAVIAKEGRAGAGVLLGLAVFVLYLLIAGPGGYAILKAKGLVRHAWLAFAASILVFAITAWSGATLLRPTKPETQHLTYFDHVFGQPEQRARTWVSALLPEYGDARISLGSVEDRRAWTQALGAWSDTTSITGKPFPDTRGYVVPARDPSSFVVPSRSTVKQLRGEWLGRAEVGVPRPISGPLSVRDEQGGTRLRGVVMHTMAAPLEEVTIIVVRGQKPLRGDLGPLGAAPLFGRVAAARLTDVWNPNTPLDFEQIPPSAWDPAERYFERLTEQISGSTTGFGAAARTGVGGDIPTRLEAISWHSALRPPQFTSQSGVAKRMLQRYDSHLLDLSAWLTQPCVIIVGQLRDAPSPVPVLIDDEPVPSRGRTVVRWIYPLPSEPPTIDGAPLSPSTNP